MPHLKEEERKRGREEGRKERKEHREGEEKGEESIPSQSFMHYELCSSRGCVDWPGLRNTLYFGTN
jgi:hypothetical protein